MKVKFHHVEVIKLECCEMQCCWMHNDNASVSVHTIESYELVREKSRRTMRQFHQSDLYREWIINHKQGMVQAVNVSGTNISASSSVSSCDDFATRKNDKNPRSKVMRTNKQPRMRRFTRRPSRASSLKSSSIMFSSGNSIISSFD